MRSVSKIHQFATAAALAGALTGARAAEPLPAAPAAPASAAQERHCAALLEASMKIFDAERQRRVIEGSGSGPSQEQIRAIQQRSGACAALRALSPKTPAPERGKGAG